ncbi:MAG TPA: hypothetical protein VFZ23_02910 [Pyrinomonadaceae bacterium]
MKIEFLGLLLSGTLLIACSNPGPAPNAVGSPTPSPSPAVTASPMPANAPADETAENDPGFEGTAGNTEKKNPNATGSAILKDVRSARHGTYDRVVFEFEGKELPNYKIEYIDRPVRSCGSGEVVPFAGDAWLSVRFSGANAHTDAGEATVKDRVRSPNLPIVKDLKLICDFEAEVEWVMGVSSPNKYRVMELKSPTRLVVDIRH